jgi:hypothetical protein
VRGFRYTVAGEPRFVTPASERWRTRIRYALLGTALVTSPIVLPFALALLVFALRDTPLGAATLDRLYLIYIGSTVCCLAALAMACRLATRRQTKRDSEI